MICFTKKGRWTGQTYSGAMTGIEVPAGLAWLEGSPSELLSSGKMLPPDAPANTSERTYSWDPVSLEYVPAPTKLGADKATVAQETSRLKSLEVDSLRAIREALLVMMTPEQRATPAGKALKTVDEEAASTRARLPKIPTPQGRQ